MKRSLLTLITTGIFFFANNIFAATLSLQPYGAQGHLSNLWSVNPNQIDSTNDHIALNGWTWQGTPGIERTLIDFDWSLIPSGAIITSAVFNLYGNVGSTQYDWPLSGSNAGYIQRVTSAWTPAVTWNTQPTTDNVHQTVLAQSVGQFDDYLNINVTSMVQDIANNPGVYHGFMFLLQNENYYRRLCFKSAYQPDSSRFPTLIINYVIGATCLTLKPYGNQGTDCEIWSVQPNSQNAGYPRIAMNAWTWQGTPGIERSLMDFNWSLIPNGAVINSAMLSLYGNVGSTENDNPLSGSNAYYIQRVTSPWVTNTVTWNTQPTTDTVHHVSMPQSVGQYDDNLNIDVMSMVLDHVNNPGMYHGFLFLLQNENYYRRFCFKSADQTDSARFPTLVICYSLGSTGLPTTSFQSSGNTFCSEAGICVDFFDHSTGNPTSWQWSFPGAATTSSNLQNPTGICYTAPGTYAVTLITTNANGSDTLTISPMITLGQPPAPPTITLTGSDTLHSSPAPSYQWYYNGSPVFGATSSSYVATSAGTYAVRITDALGCSAISNGFTYVSVNELSQQNGFEIYPNPTSGEFTIYGLTPGPSPKARGERGIIEIYDVVGEKVFSEVFPSLLWRGAWGEATINFKLPPGVYFVKVSCPDNFGKNKETEWMKKIVVE